MTTRLFAAVSVIFALGACDPVNLSRPDGLSDEKWDVGPASDAPLPEDPYLAALQEGYVRLARAELAEFDWVDGAEFIERAEAVAEGARVAPFKVADRISEGPELEALTAAEAELGGFIASAGAMLRAGRQIGEAQVHFDCWVQEAEEGHQSADIEACREAYTLMMVLVRDLGALPKNMAVVLPKSSGEVGGIEISQDGNTVTLDTAFAAAGTGKKLGDVPVEEGEIRDAFAGALAAQPEPPVKFTVLFASGSTRIDDEGYDVIARAAEEAFSRPAAEFVVTGFTDRTGSGPANRRLSNLRAARVRREILREIGAKSGDTGKMSVATSAKGATQFADPDDTAGAANRRVEILVR